MTKPKLRKHTLFLFEGDYLKLGELHPDLPTAEVVRILIRKHIASVEEQVPAPNVDFELTLTT